MPPSEIHGSKTMTRRRLHLLIKGYVQGVFFRAHTVEEAKKLCLTGWVRNVGGDCVEVVAEGEEDRLEKLKQWAHHGPPSARVTHVQANFEPATGAYGKFSVRY